VAWPRPAAAAESSECGRGNAVGRTSILDRGQSRTICSTFFSPTTSVGLWIDGGRTFSKYEHLGRVSASEVT